MILNEQQREILFRGKSYNIDRWVEGSVYIGNSNYWIRTSRDLWGIYPKTIGQYTGFKDSNGRKVFEHDIVHCRKSPYHLLSDATDLLVNKTTKEFTGQVIMQKGAWVVKHSDRTCFQLVDAHSVKVLGNVFDDFELLEE